MMETVTTMILSALAAGAAASGKDIASQAVQDAYQGLKALVQRKFSDQPKASAVLEEYEKDPGTWEKPLEKKLTEAGADRDSQIFQAAEQLLKLLESHPGGSKYQVDIKDSQVGAIGDHATVEMNIGKEAKRK